MPPQLLESQLNDLQYTEEELMCRVQADGSGRYPDVAGVVSMVVDKMQVVEYGTSCLVDETLFLLRRE